VAQKAVSALTCSTGGRPSSSGLERPEAGGGALGSGRQRASLATEATLPLGRPHLDRRGTEGQEQKVGVLPPVAWSAVQKTLYRLDGGLPL
jgi:hypothetical protein